MRNTYEKVAALLIGAVPALRLLYTVKKAADELGYSPVTPNTRFEWKALAKPGENVLPPLKR